MNPSQKPEGSNPGISIVSVEVLSGLIKKEDNRKGVKNEKEIFNTTAGNPVKKILLKLNLSDHRLFKDGGGDFRYSDTTHLSQSVEVLKLKNFKKDATLKLSKSTNQERYFQIPIDPQDQEKTTFTCPYGTFAYRRMPFGLCNSPRTFQRYDAETVRRHQSSSKLGEVPFHGQRGHYALHHYEKELLAVVYAFEKFRSYLVLSKTIVYTDHSALKYLFVKQDAKPRLLRWILLLQEFNIKIRNKKGAENLASDHLSILENPHQGDLVGLEMNENFPHESLNMISLNPDNEPSWFADIANYLVGNVLIKGILFGGVWTGKKLWIFSRLAIMVPPGDIMA
ncbi:reverse transcriptase domain-containing protein [Tanacetum coccineum]